MTTAALAWGSALLAFSPILSLLFFLSYPKAQLVIVVTTSAFFFLCSALAASLAWYLLDPVIGLPGGGVVWTLLPGVLAQFLFRCAFVRVYHMVEQVIQQSIEQHEAEQQPPPSTMGNSTLAGTDQALAAAAAAAPQPAVPATANDEDSDSLIVGNRQGANATANATPLSSMARLHLEMNDFVSALAAATGYGGMHAILFYGTLLASEASVSSSGTLYQPSCLALPSLVVSAITTCLFSILDIFWMLFTFFGMRRRLLFHRHEGSEVLLQDDAAAIAVVPMSSSYGALFGDSRHAGNTCLVLCLVSHLCASLATTTNLWTNGCVASLPLTAVVTLVTAYLYVAGISAIYLPPEKRNDRMNAATPPPSDPYHRD